MPSLHVGWNLLMDITNLRCTATRWAKAFGMLMPRVVHLAIGATAHHYALDGISGPVVARLGLAIAYLGSRMTALVRLKPVC